MSLNKRIVSLMSFSIKMCLSFVSKYAKYNDAGISSNLTGIKSPELEFEPFQLFKLNKREAIFYDAVFFFRLTCVQLHVWTSVQQCYFLGASTKKQVQCKIKIGVVLATPFKKTKLLWILIQQSETQVKKRAEICLPF